MHNNTIVLLSGAALLALTSTAQAQDKPVDPAPAQSGQQSGATNSAKPTTPNTPENNGAPTVDTGKGKGTNPGVA